MKRSNRRLTPIPYVIAASIFLLTASAFADSGGANYSTVEEYALEVIGGGNKLVVKQATSPSDLVVAVVHTEGLRRTSACCPPHNSYDTDKAGLVAVFKASDNHLILVDSSNIFRLPLHSTVERAYASEVVIERPDRFTVRIECQQCTDSIAGPFAFTSVRFHFALRRGQWLVSGLDREISKVVGSKVAETRTRERIPILGVVERVSHNYRTGHRTVRVYKFDEAKARMSLVRKVGTQGKSLHMPLDAFDPTSEILGGNSDANGAQSASL